MHYFGNMSCESAHQTTRNSEIESTTYNTVWKIKSSDLLIILFITLVDKSINLVFLLCNY